MFFTVGKEYHFEAAHCLPNYEGVCSNLHGHSYKVEVSVTGNKVSNDMVLDYNKLDEIVEPIVKAVDHSYILSSKPDEFGEAIYKVCEEYGRKVWKINIGACTAESIANEFCTILTKEFQEIEHIVGLTVVVKETEKTYAKVSRSIR